MSTLNSSFKSLLLVALTTGTLTSLDAQFTQNRNQLDDNATAMVINTSEEETFNAHDFLPEDHRSDVVIFRDANFEGGSAALKSYLLKNFEYPEQARQNGIEGRMVAQFEVDQNGQVNNVKIVQSADELLDSELVRVLENMPNWLPALEYGYSSTSVVLLPFKVSLK